MVYKPTSLYIDPTKRTQEMEDFGIRSLPEFKGSAYNLGAVEGFPDVRYATTDYGKYSDLYRLYSGMPGGFDAAQDDFVTPPAAPPGGGDSGGGGVGTGGTGGGTGGVNTPEQQRLIDEGIGVQTGPGAPVSAPGEGMLTQEAIDDLADYPINTEYKSPYATGDANVAEQFYAKQRADKARADEQAAINREQYMTGEYTPTETYIGTGRADLLEAAGGEAGGADAYFEDDLMDYDEHYDMGGVKKTKTLEEAFPGMSNSEIIDLMNKDATQKLDTSEIEQILADETLSSNYPQEFVIPGTVEPQAVKTILGPDGITYDAATGQPIYEDLDAQAVATDLALGTQDLVTQKDLEDNRSLLQKLGLPVDFDLKKAAIEAGINLAAGMPISLIAKAVGAVLPARDPRQTALDEFYATGEGAQYMDPTSPNYNIVSGGALNTLTGGRVGEETTYGLQDAYQDRIDTIEKTLAEKYPDGDYSDTQLDERLAALKEAKAKEFAMLDKVTDEMGDVQQDRTQADIDADILMGDGAVMEEEVGDEGTLARIEHAQNVQEIQQQEIARNDNDKDRQQRDTGVAKVAENKYETKSGDVYASANEAAEKSDGPSGGKIVCTMMNESYGFGSFRNKIWLKHSKGLAPEYQRGYHKIFLPLVKLSKKNKLLKKTLEHIAVHRTIDIRQEARGKVHLLGRIYRKILEPICYWVGKNVKK